MDPRGLSVLRHSTMHCAERYPKPSCRELSYMPRAFPRDAERFQFTLCPIRASKILAQKKTEHGTEVPCSVDSFLNQLPGREPNLLQGRAGHSGARTGSGVADHTGLVREKHALTGRTYINRSARDRIADRRRISVAGPNKRIAALGASRENRVKQARVRRGSRARCCAAQRCQGGREALAGVGRRKRH